MPSPREALKRVDDALDELEAKLGPLLEKPLHETLEGLDRLQQAKLCVTIPYIVNDLVWVYLKTQGVDPKTHTVHNELERLKDHSTKVRQAENPDAAPLPRVSQQNRPLDKAAATRFINAALASADREFRAEQAQLGITGPTISSHTTFTPHQKYTMEVANVGGGVHTRFAHIERDDTTTSESDNEDIAVFAEAPELQGSHHVQHVATGAEQRKRSPLDPFVGYDRAPFENRTKAVAADTVSTRASAVVASGRNRPAATDFMDIDDAPPQSPSDGGPKRPKNERKRARRKGKTAMLKGLPDRAAHSSSRVTPTGSSPDTTAPESQ